MKSIYEIVLHFNQFRNIDLFRQGLYMIKAKMYRQNPNLELKSTSNTEYKPLLALPYQFFNGKAKQSDRVKGQNEIMQHYVANIDDLNHLFYSSAFRIQYQDQKVYLNEGCIFRIDLEPSDMEEIYFDIELLFYEQIIPKFCDLNDINWPKSSEFNCVATVTLKLMPSLFSLPTQSSNNKQQKYLSNEKINSKQNFHNNISYPIIFSHEYFCQVDAMFHVILINRKFNLNKRRFSSREFLEQNLLAFLQHRKRKHGNRISETECNALNEFNKDNKICIDKTEHKNPNKHSNGDEKNSKHISLQSHLSQTPLLDNKEFSMTSKSPNKQISKKLNSKINKCDFNVLIDDIEYKFNLADVNNLLYEKVLPMPLFKAIFHQNYNEVDLFYNYIVKNLYCSFLHILNIFDEYLKQFLSCCFLTDKNLESVKKEFEQTLLKHKNRFQKSKFAKRFGNHIKKKSSLQAKTEKTNFSLKLNNTKSLHGLENIYLNESSIMNRIHIPSISPCDESIQLSIKTCRIRRTIRRLLEAESISKIICDDTNLLASDIFVLQNDFVRLLPFVCKPLYSTLHKKWEKSFVEQCGTLIFRETCLYAHRIKPVCDAKLPEHLMISEKLRLSFNNKMKNLHDFVSIVDVRDIQESNGCQAIIFEQSFNKKDDNKKASKTKNSIENNKKDSFNYKNNFAKNKNFGIDNSNVLSKIERKISHSNVISTSSHSDSEIVLQSQVRPCNTHNLESKTSIKSSLNENDFENLLQNKEYTEQNETLKFNLLEMLQDSSINDNKDDSVEQIFSNFSSSKVIQAKNDKFFNANKLRKSRALTLNNDIKGNRETNFSSKQKLLGAKNIFSNNNSQLKENISSFPPTLFKYSNTLNNRQTKNQNFKNNKHLLLKSNYNNKTISGALKNFLHLSSFSNKNSKNQTLKRERFLVESDKDLSNKLNNSQTFSILKPKKYKHLFIFCHGYQGNSWDMRLLKNYLQAMLTTDNSETLCDEIQDDENNLYLLSTSNENQTQDDIEKMGHRLAEEIVSYIEYSGYRNEIQYISFICHSLGGIIMRSCLTCSIMKPYLSRLYSFISLAVCHSGYLYAANFMLSSGLWLIKKQSKSKCLSQLSLTDTENRRESFMYNLSKQPGLEYFKNVLLVSSPEDRYTPYHSARIEIHSRSLRDSEQGEIYGEMVHNILRPLQNVNLIRFDISFTNVKRNLDTFIGRAAHIFFLDKPVYIKMLLCVYRQYFDPEILSNIDSYDAIKS